MKLAYLTVALAAVIGWSDGISVQPSRSDRLHASFQKSLAGLDRPSERTLDTLRRYDLERRYRKDVDGALAALQKAAQTAPEPDLVYALAELSWVEGKRLDRWRRPAAIDRYLDAVAFAYDFLFEPDLKQGREPSDPRFRTACDLYNGGLDRLIRAAQSNGQVLPDNSIGLKVHGRTVSLRIALTNSPWKPEDVDQIILASDFEVTGLETRSYQYGVGVPLIGVHRPDQPGKDAEKFYPPEMAFPLTAFLRPEFRLRNPGAGAEEPRRCILELVDPVRVRRVGEAPAARRAGEAPAELLVEADLTTPLAYMWSRTDLNRYRWAGLLRPGQAMSRANLMLLRPYEPNKIPVVMVHGLISSPLAWIPMLNELLRDPVIQKRYQFLLYMYPTGVPIPIAAAGLRETLQTAQQMYDPQGQDPAFEHMVLLGHSMGGLLSHAMSVDSGDRFWQLYSDRPFTDITGEAEVLNELRRFLFFDRLPFVQRVVFLATPHHGSELSRNMIGRVGSNLIAEPDFISAMLAKLIRNNPDAFDARQFRRMPTSIDTLEPNHPVLRALLEMKADPTVEYHSIIGSLRPGPRETTTDGVVPYLSAHLEGPNVKSELTVRSDHGVQKDQEAIREVRRILYLHLGVAPSPVVAGPGAAPGAEATRQAAGSGGLLRGRR